MAMHKMYYFSIITVSTIAGNFLGMMSSPLRSAVCSWFRLASRWHGYGVVENHAQRRVARYLEEEACTSWGSGP